MRRTLIFSLFLSVPALIFIIAWKSSNWSQTEINIAEVDSILISPHLNTDSLSRKLSDDQAKQFTEDWNDAESVGPCKYISTHQLTAYMKDGTKRGFRANGKTVKEKTKNDYGFRMKEEDYFEKLWANAK
jgi:hypothetical protein